MGERNRIKIRVRSAMAAITATEGRYLGGRPSCGYELIDAGPHPDPAKAADGKTPLPLRPWLVTAFSPTRIKATIEAMAARASGTENTAATQLRKQLATS